MVANQDQHLVYLITGANRGIGRQLISTLLARENVIVIAAVRNPTSPTSVTLSELPTGANSKLIVVKIDSHSPTDANDAVASLVKSHSIEKLDVVIANAGIAPTSAYVPVADGTAKQLQEHINVNAIGPFLLIKAVLPLLKKANNTGKFVVIGSAFGSIGGMEQRPFSMGIYGASKALVHHITRKIHQENEDIIAFVVDPGFVQSEAGNEGAVAFGMKEAPVTLKDAGDFIIAKVDEATRENTSGHFLAIEGGEFPW